MKVKNTRISRGEMLDEIVRGIQEANASGVLLIGEAGAGKTALSYDVADALANTMKIVRIEGSKSIAHISYGALVPLLGKTDGPEVESPTSLTVALTGSLRAAGAGSPSGFPLLLIVDDADELDGASASFLTQLLVSGKARALVTTTTAYNPALDLLSEQYDRVLTRMQVQRLSHSEVHRICRKALGGSVSNTISVLLWTFSGGNPRRLHTNVEQLRHGVSLVRSGNAWLLTTPAEVKVGVETDSLQHRMDALPRQSREILELIAFADPVPLEALKAMGALVDLDVLHGQGLVRVSDNGGMQVRPGGPLQAEAIRGQVLCGRNQELFERFRPYRPGPTSNPEAVVRYAMWSLQCGETISSADLVDFARAAVGLADPYAAMTLADAVDEPEHAAAAGVEKAYALYFGQRPLDALDCLENACAGIRDVETLKRMLILRDVLNVHVDGRNAMGASGPEKVAIMIRSLPQGEDNQKAADSCLRVSELLALASPLSAGDTGEAKDKVAGILKAAEAASDDEATLLAVTLQGGQLVRMGQSPLALEKTSQAVKLLQGGCPRLGIHLERVLRTHLLALTQAGQVAEVEQMISRLSAFSWRHLARFSQEADLAQGLVYLQRGQWKRSLEQVGVALETIGFSGRDSAKSVGCALAAFVAGLADDPSASQKYVDLYETAGASKTAGGQLLAQALLAAGSYFTGQAPDAARQLNELADQAQGAGYPTLELEIRSLALHCGDDSGCGRTIILARQMDGQRALLAERCAVAVTQRDLEALQHVAAEAFDTGFALVALGPLAWAHKIADQAGDKIKLTEIRRLHSIVKPKRNGKGALQGSHRLTRREREIVFLVMKGYSNSKVAKNLQLSVRTIESHMYRAYDKLQVTSRDQLAGHHLE